MHKIAIPSLPKQSERRATAPYISPDEMTRDRTYVLAAHFASARETRFVGPFRPILPISRDQLVRGMYCTNVELTQEGDRLSAVLLPSAGHFVTGRIEYALYEYTPAFAVRLEEIAKRKRQYLEHAGVGSKY